jgi:hypothetical protein
MPTPRLPRTTADSSDALDDLLGELSEVEWLGPELGARRRRSNEPGPRDESSIWSRLLAWTE